MGWDWSTFWYIVVIGLLIIAFILVLMWLVHLLRKRAKGPSHIELYFDENFRKIMDEWDFTTRDRVKQFKRDMGTRLNKVGGDITALEERKNTLDKRMDRLEKDIGKMEGL